MLYGTVKRTLKWNHLTYDKKSVNLPELTFMTSFSIDLLNTGTEVFHSSVIHLVIADQADRTKVL